MHPSPRPNSTLQDTKLHRLPISEKFVGEAQPNHATEAKRLVCSRELHRMTAHLESLVNDINVLLESTFGEAIPIAHCNNKGFCYHP
jgi:hypothetical protein